MVQSGLVVVHGHDAAGTAVSAFSAATGLSVDSLRFSCGAQLPAQGQFGAALVLAGSQQLDHDSYARVIKVLAPGGKLYVLEQDAGKQQQLQGTLVLAGYMDCSVSDSMVTASKPAWEVGAKSLLKKRPAAPAATPQPAATAAQAWKIGAGDDDEELVDEDELLTEEDKRAAAAAPAAGGDCSTSRKACKNCSCGRAEAEAAGQKVELTQEMLDNPKTNCGSCALGDAFRCAGCPYRGLPAFEPGKKITLSANFLTADA